MKKMIIFAIFSFFFHTGGISQPCLPQGITFTTQSQIDSFQINYPNCTRIEGEVIIEGSNIKNLDGLNTMISFGSNVTIINNDSLQSLVGLHNIESITGDLWIENNNQLLSLVGLDNLEIIEGTLKIGGYNNGGNSFLVSLEGLNTLTNIGQDLNLTYNKLLSDLSGLENLISIGRHLVFQENLSLESFDGINNLQSIGGTLWIEENLELLNINSLTGLTNIMGDVMIQGNDLLENLNGIENIESNSILNLEINWNYTLENCAVKSLCDYLASPNGTITIHDNNEGCNSKTEIEQECASSIIDHSSNKNDPFLYPNPAQKEIHITPIAGMKIYKIQIYNNIGHLVLEKEENLMSTVDISDFDNGIYYIEIQLYSSVVRTKFIKY